MGPGAQTLLRIAVAAIYGRRMLTFLVLLAFTALMAVQALYNALIPQATRVIFDDAIPKPDLRLLGIIVGAMVAASSCASS